MRLDWTKIDKQMIGVCLGLLDKVPIVTQIAPRGLPCAQGEKKKAKDGCMTIGIYCDY